MARISTYPLAQPLDGTEEFIGVQNAGSFKVTAEQLKIYTEEGMLTGNVSRTIAMTGGDFANMTELFDWMSKTLMSNVELFVSVQPGVYNIPDAGSGVASYKLVGSQLSKVTFEGTDSATCFFNINNSSLGKAFIYAANMHVTIKNLTFNNAGQLATIAELHTASLILEGIIAPQLDYIFSADASHTILNSCTFGCANAGVKLYNTADLLLDGGSIDGQDTAVIGIYGTNNISVVGGNSTVVQNFVTGFLIENSSKAVLGTHTMSGNVTDYNPPLNALQGDGGYITDGSLSSGNVGGDVLEFLSIAEFPVTGEGNKIYIAIDTSLMYRWGGIVYEELAPQDDEILEYNTLSAFPLIGEPSKIYVALDTNLLYRYSGSGYVNVAPAPVDSVAGKTGEVILGIGDIVGLQSEIDAGTAHRIDTSIHFLTTDVTQDDVELDRVDNTADNEKNINGGYF